MICIGLTGLKGDSGLVGEPGLPGPVIEIKGKWNEIKYFTIIQELSKV